MCLLLLCFCVWVVCVFVCLFVVQFIVHRIGCFFVLLILLFASALSFAPAEPPSALPRQTSLPDLASLSYLCAWIKCLLAVRPPSQTSQPDLPLSQTSLSPSQTSSQVLDDETSSPKSLPDLPHRPPSETSLPDLWFLRGEFPPLQREGGPRSSRPWDSLRGEFLPRESGVLRPIFGCSLQGGAVGGGCSGWG